MLKWLALLFLALSHSAYAAATDKLKTFIASTHSGQADFTQVLLDKNGKKIQSASGTMQFVRPGKFRWVYRKPYEQYIVGDGVKFWLYDADLNQVTVKKLDAALGSSPAALLSGSNEIERGFTLKDSGEKRRSGLARGEAKNPGHQLRKHTHGVQRAIRIGRDGTARHFRPRHRAAFLQYAAQPAIVTATVQFRAAQGRGCPGRRIETWWKSCPLQE